MDDTIIPEERHIPSDKQPICHSDIESRNSNEECKPWGDRKVNSFKEEKMVDEVEEDEKEPDLLALARANTRFSVLQQLAKENESIEVLYERVSKTRSDLEECYLDVLSLLYPHLLFSHGQFCKAPRNARALFTKLYWVGVTSAIAMFLMPFFACNSSRADELINMLMYAHGKGVRAAGLRSFIMRRGGIDECIEEAAGRSTL